MCAYFLFLARPSRLPNVFFGLLLLMLSLRIGKSALYFFDRDLPKTLLQIGLSACFFVGPMLYFYVRTVLRKQNTLSQADRMHLLLLSAVITVLGLLFPYARRPELWNPEMVQGIYTVWIAYVVAAGVQIWPLFYNLIQQPSKTTVLQKWLLIVYGTNVLICLMYNSILYLGFPSYIYGPITFSMVFYVLMAFLIFYPGSRTIIDGQRSRYSNKSIDTKQALELEAKLKELMQQERLFQNPRLKLPELAQRLEVPPHLLSQFLNDNLGQSFSEFVHSYRVEAACILLRSKPQLTMEGIGQEVGFRSKTSFYTAFKKIKGQTPSQFAKNGVKL